MLRRAVAVAAAALLLVLAPSSADPVAFKVCTGRKDQLGISAVDVGEAKASSPVTIFARGKANVPMAAGARIQMQFRQGNSQTPVRQYDFCGAVKNGGSGAACPVAKGKTFAMMIIHDVSKFAKAGPAVATVTIVDARGRAVSCLTADINIVA